MGSYATELELIAPQAPLTAYEADVLIIPVYQVAEKSTDKTEKTTKSREKTATFTWPQALIQADKAMQGHLKDTLKAEKYTADCAKRRLFRVRSNDTLSARWIVVVGLGTPEKLRLDKLQKAVLAGLKDTYAFEGVRHVGMVLPEETKALDSHGIIQACVFAAHQSTYKTHEAGAEKCPKLEKMVLLTEKKHLKLEPALLSAKAMALAESYTKDLANMPANLKTAEVLADAARDLKSLPGVTVDVISDRDTIQESMPAFWAVAQGSAKSDPPRFIRASYCHPQTKRPKKHIALVGKGVIFDTGGVQVKTGNGMNDMKFDMTGAASVLGILQAAAELKLKGIRVSIYIAATRNAIGEWAYLPDSIISSASGKRIEIRHTDAEGRVTLADAVHRATLDHPDEVITIATLTGSAGVAVGHCIALMGTNDNLVSRLEKTCQSVGEPVQTFTFFEEDFDNVKSDRDAAELCNTSKSRFRGHLSAGAFVMSFAQDIPAAHLDIAGGDAKDGNATGIAVKGLIEFLIQEAGS